MVNIPDPGGSYGGGSDDSGGGSDTQSAADRGAFGSGSRSSASDGGDGGSRDTQDAADRGAFGSGSRSSASDPDPEPSGDSSSGSSSSRNRVERNAQQSADQQQEPADPAPQGGDRRLQAAAETQAAAQQDGRRMDQEMRAGRPDVAGGDRLLTGGISPGDAGLEAAAERTPEQRARENFVERRQDVRGVARGATRGAADEAAPLGSYDKSELRFETNDDGSTTVRPTEDATRDRAREQIVAENPGVEPEDIESVERTEDGFRATIRQEPEGPTRDDLDPLTALAVPEGRVEQAAAGEDRIEQLADQGSPSAQVFEAGGTIQEASAEIGEGVETIGEQTVDSPVVPAAVGVVTRDVAAAQRTRRILDADVGGDGVSVGNQLASTAGGFAEFPGLVAGGVVQAASIPGVAEAESQRSGRASGIDAGTLASSTARGARQQASLVRDRPVEAAAILAPAAAASGRARVRSGSRSRTGRTQDNEPGVTESRSLSTRAQQGGRRVRARAEEFLADESAQSQLGGRSRSRSRSESQDTVDPAGRRQSPDLDPRVFERNRGRGPGRAEPIEPEVSGRPPRGGDRASFRQDVQRARRQPETDLRQAVEFADAAQAQSGGNVVPGAVNRVEQAQEPSLRVDDTLEASVEDVRAAAVEPELQAQQQPELQAQQEPEVDIRQTPDVDATADVRGRQDARNSGRQQSRPATPGSDVRAATSTRSDVADLAAVDTRADVSQQSRADTAERATPTDRTTTPTTTGVPDRTPGGGGGRRGFRLPFAGDFPQGGQRDFSPADPGEPFDNEFSNPVAAPDELDEVAADVLGRDEEDRRDPMDGLAALPSDPENRDKDSGGFPALEDL